MPKARSAECKCEYNFTCGYCCRNAKPYHFTPSTSAEIIARQSAPAAAPRAKPAMQLKWADERNARPISRDSAAATIRANRNNPNRAAWRIVVKRQRGDTYITSTFLQVGCVIFRADSRGFV